MPTSGPSFTPSAAPSSSSPSLSPTTTPTSSPSLPSVQEALALQPELQAFTNLLLADNEVSRKLQNDPAYIFAPINQAINGHEGDVVIGNHITSNFPTSLDNPVTVTAWSGAKYTLSSSSTSRRRQSILIIRGNSSSSFLAAVSQTSSGYIYSADRVLIADQDTNSRESDNKAATDTNELSTGETAVISVVVVLFFGLFVMLAFSLNKSFQNSDEDDNAVINDKSNANLPPADDWNTALNALERRAEYHSPEHDQSDAVNFARRTEMSLGNHYYPAHDVESLASWSYGINSANPTELNSFVQNRAPTHYFPEHAQQDTQIFNHTNAGANRRSRGLTAPLHASLAPGGFNHVYRQRHQDRYREPAAYLDPSALHSADYLDPHAMPQPVLNQGGIQDQIFSDEPDHQEWYSWKVM